VESVADIGHANRSIEHVSVMDNRLAGEYIENSILSPLQITLARLMFAKEAFLCNSSLLRSVVGSHSGRHGAFYL
jgi:hypothetical protein